MEHIIEVKQLPAWELPCKQCGSRDYIHSVIIVNGKEKHSCTHCGNKVSNSTKPCKTCGCEEFSAYVSAPSKRSRFLCADCGAHRTVYMVTQFGEELQIESAEGRSVSVKFDRFRVVCTLSVVGWHSNRVTNVQVFSPYHAFGTVVKQLVEFDEKAPKETWTHKKGSISNEAARRRLYGTFMNWWTMNVHPTEAVVLAQRKMFSLAGSMPERILDTDDIWTNPMAVRDMSFRGACIVLAEYANRKWRFERGWTDLPLAEKYPNPDRWMETLTESGKLSRAARVTIMNLPGGLPRIFSEVLHDQDALQLIDRPRLSRLECLAWMYVSSNKLRLKTRPWVKNVLMKATGEQLKKGFNLYKEHMTRFANQKVTMRKTRHVSDYFGWLADMNAEFSGTSVSKLTERVARWHQDAHLRRAADELKILGIVGSFPTLVPVKKLPEFLNGSIQLLKTAEELLTNGISMGHCVGSYVPYACGMNTNKTSHIFTIETQGERATAEVSIEGRVVQSRGPRNGQNKAAEVLEKVLNEWVREWPNQNDLKTKVVLRSRAYELLRYGSTDGELEIINEINEIKDHMSGEKETMPISRQLLPNVDYFDLDAPFED